MRRIQIYGGCEKVNIPLGSIPLGSIHKEMQPEPVEKGRRGAELVEKYYVVVTEKDLDPYSQRGYPTVTSPAVQYISKDLLSAVSRTVWSTYPCFAYEEINDSGKYYFAELIEGAFTSLHEDYCLYQVKGKPLEGNVKTDEDGFWAVIEGQILHPVYPDRDEEPDLFDEVTEECGRRGVELVYHHSYLAFKHYYDI